MLRSGSMVDALVLNGCRRRLTHDADFLRSFLRGALHMAAVARHAQERQNSARVRNVWCVLKATNRAVCVERKRRGPTAAGSGQTQVCGARVVRQSRRRPICQAVCSVKVPCACVVCVRTEVFA